jgi:hypothetical protein
MEKWFSEIPSAFKERVTAMSDEVNIDPRPRTLKSFLGGKLSKEITAGRGPRPFTADGTRLTRIRQRK